MYIGIHEDVEVKQRIRRRLSYSPEFSQHSTLYHHTRSKTYFIALVDIQLFYILVVPENCFISIGPRFSLRGKCSVLYYTPILCVLYYS